MFYYLFCSVVATLLLDATVQSCRATFSNQTTNRRYRSDDKKRLQILFECSTCDNCRPCHVSVCCKRDIPSKLSVWPLCDDRLSKCFDDPKSPKSLPLFDERTDCDATQRLDCQSLFVVEVVDFVGVGICDDSLRDMLYPPQGLMIVKSKGHADLKVQQQPLLCGSYCYYTYCRITHQ